MTLRHDVIYFENKRIGTISIGQTAQASDGASEVDLSGASVVAYASPNDWNATFRIRNAAIAGNGGLINIGMGSFNSDLDGARRDLIRYDSPTFMGFTLSTSWGEDDFWDVALRYAQEFGGVVRVAAAVAYREVTDEGTPSFSTAVSQTAGVAETDNNTIHGSISMIHLPTGLNLTFGIGQNTNEAALASSATGQKYDEVSFWYLKAGIFQKFFAAGKTAIYGEYGQYDDFLAGLGAGSGGASGSGARALSVNDDGAVVTGSESTVWGLGIVQKIDKAAMELYVAYRHYEFDVDVADSTGANVAAKTLEDFDAVLAGARIKF